MTRYIFKTIVTGTNNNKLFNKVERTHYSGKCNLSNWGRDFFVEEHMSDSSIKMALIHMAKEYGYSTRKAAENYLRKMNNVK